MSSGPVCACGCGAQVPRRGRRGPFPLYATQACRMRAFRQRKRVPAVPAPLVPVGSPLEEAPSPRQVQRAIVEARTVAFALQRLGGTAPHGLAWRCEKAGRLMLDALTECFGDGIL